MNRLVSCTFAALVAFVAVQADAAPAPLDVPKLAFRDRTLANGLRVLSVEDHTTPDVSVQVWYRVGSKDDPEGRSGFAHLFEHLMFKSTRHLAAEQFDRLTEDVGGNNNASTEDDRTNFFEVVPANHLDRLLWAEAERMANLDVNQPNFVSERAVVEEELRQTVLAAPYGRLFDAIPRDSWRVHPYRRPTIGSAADLDSATLSDVQAFHATYYRPDNAVLIVTGDFEPAALDAAVDRYFGPLQHPAAAIPRVTTVEPPWPDDRTFDVRAPNVPLPAVAMTWLGPAADAKDAVALDVAASMLGDGASSRLYQSLVYRAQVASDVGFGYEAHVDAGLITAYAIAASGKPLQANLQRMRETIAALARGPVPEAELAKIKTQRLTQALLQRQTPRGVAEQLGDATLIEGDPNRVNTDLVALQAVTGADVQRVLKRWVLDAHSNTLTYRAEGAPAAAGGKDRP